MRVIILGLTGVLIAGIQLAPAQVPKDSAEIVIREALVVPPMGRLGRSAGRSALHTDAIEHQIVTGQWKTPKEGEQPKLLRAWKSLSAGADGWFADASLTGGYAFCSVPSTEKRVMILEASGHGMVYVNGEPRMGDPYQAGYVRLPVELKAGDNEFLFQVGRGRFRAKLMPAKGKIQFDPADTTLPDFVVGMRDHLRGGIVVLNCSDQTLNGGAIRGEGKAGFEVGGGWMRMPPFSSRKVIMEIISKKGPIARGDHDIGLRLQSPWDVLGAPIDSTSVKLRVLSEEDTRRITFTSKVDESVQYYAHVPMRTPSSIPRGESPGLVVTLHGAGVEALGQAAAYAPKDWAHIVAPTNRRPFGFDWEDWGREDALEVLLEASEGLKPDHRRTCLTGHSMGGHGVWQLGALFPDKWAAIAPSAGWISMYSYAGASRPENPDPRVEILHRAASTSDTLAMLKNYTHHGVYLLHGEKDDNVPVTQARDMRKHLGLFHPDFAYYERPGAGHWWGNACVDWPPLFRFLSERTIPDTKDVRSIDFTTLNPGVSAKSHWLKIETQEKAHRASNLSLTYDPDKRLFTGTSQNVQRFSLDVQHLQAGKPLAIDLDGQKLGEIPWPENDREVWLERTSDGWRPSGRLSISMKGPHRSGPFKQAFRENFQLVYGTKGTPAEARWALAKARYDAEVFWYRGNGSVDVLRDTDFDPLRDGIHRNVILYGNADTNAAWTKVLNKSPVQVVRGKIRISDREIVGEDLACMFLYPREDTACQCVAAVSGTGLTGMRLTDRIPYFVSGVGIPDLLVLDPSSLEKAEVGIVVAGFFGNDWSVKNGDFAWRP